MPWSKGTVWSALPLLPMLLSGVEVCCAPPAMGQAPNGYSNDALALALAAYLGGAAQVSRRAVVRANRGGGPHGASRQPGARHGDRLKDGGRDRCGAALGYFGLRDVWMIRLEAVGVETSHPLPQAWPPPLSKSDPGVGSRVDRFYVYYDELGSQSTQVLGHVDCRTLHV